MSWPALVLVGLLLIAANAFFVAVEFSLLAARRGVVEQWAEEGRAGAVSAVRGMRSLNAQLAVCQLGITVMSLLLGWLVEPTVERAIEHLLGRTTLPEGLSRALGIAVALTLVSLVHMVLGEMVPKSVALGAPERTAVLVAPVNRMVASALRPVVWALQAMGNAGARLLRVEPTDELAQAHSVAELAVMMQQSAAGGELEAEEAGLLRGALGFLGVKVGEVLVPREDLATVDEHATVAEAEEVMHRSGHSRVLVTGEHGTVNGFLHAKDLLRLRNLLPSDELPEGLARTPLRVSPEMPLVDLPPQMRRTRRHVAVVERDGELLGLVTLEDALEAIVGDIRDESDRAGHLVRGEPPAER
jgi:CBS domain containing-hemolysin-like protein